MSRNIQTTKKGGERNTGSGRIVVACLSTITGDYMREMITDFGLKFDTCCVPGEFYFIQVPKGKEDRWARAFSSQIGVISAQPVPLFSH
ncbi:MAG: hypothetical protein Q8R36_03630 [bacterium]|nr:hypothetical protein [bacterium]